MLDCPKESPLWRRLSAELWKIRFLTRVFLNTDVLKTVSSSSVYLENSWYLVRNRAMVYMFQLPVQRVWAWYNRQWEFVEDFLELTMHESRWVLWKGWGRVNVINVEECAVVSLCPPLHMIVFHKGVAYNLTKGVGHSFSPRGCLKVNCLLEPWNSVSCTHLLMSLIG